MTSRPETFARVTSETLDVLVIGGGIVGVAVARDAAMRGLRTGLVERHDFAFGTSSRSSRLLHGGIRYLAQGRIQLVREASVEKAVLRRIAPHLAEPLPFVFPTYQQHPEWKLWQLKIGVKLYDALCSGRNAGHSSWLSREQTLALVPNLASEGLRGAVRYFDALTNDARLVIDTLRSAEGHGAAVLNYCRYHSARRECGTWICEIEDTETNRTYTIRAKSVVNATGPWADGLPHSAVKLRLTKGIHCVLDRQRLPVPSAVVMTSGHRILFVIPWGARVILGTTDTDYSGSLENVVADPSDVSTVLEITNHHFPGANITTADVLSTWAGLRPLVADPRGLPSDISRAHEIRSPEANWWDVTGGKLTTCRLMAAQTIDRLTRAAGLSTGISRTATEPLLRASVGNDFSAVLPPEVSREAVEHFCAAEWAIHLDDVIVRRSNWQHYRSDVGEVAAQVAGWMGERYGWDANRRVCEIARCNVASEDERGRARTGIETIMTDS